MKAQTEFNEEQANENISNILARQKQKERENTFLNSLFSYSNLNERATR